MLTCGRWRTCVCQTAFKAFSADNIIYCRIWQFTTISTDFEKAAITQNTHSLHWQWIVRWWIVRWWIVRWCIVLHPITNPKSTRTKPFSQLQFSHELNAVDKREGLNKLVHTTTVVVHSLHTRFENIKPFGNLSWFRNETNELFSLVYCTGMLCWTMLCHARLCYAILGHPMPWYAMLCYARPMWSTVVMTRTKQ